ncbi:hypothetical protein ACIBCT_39680 [Streptosporangium sp. NPDC050855]|uniref:hypothetical protein n=1 Tax=Streptosporangium sp. NPDC050855 TaxID=3366194 RepID=UPI0037BBD3AF
MIGALRAEWGRTWSIRSPWFCLAGAVLTVVGIAGTLANDFVHGLGTGEHGTADTMAASDAAGPAVQFGLVVFAAFAMITITSEYATAGILATFQAEPRRVLVLAAKAAVAAGVGLPAGALAGCLATALAHLTLGGHAAPASEVAAVTGLRAGALFAVSAVLVVALGALIRSAVGTLAVAVVLLVGTLALPSVAAWTPAGAVAEFLGAGQGTYPPIAGLLVVAAWAAALFAGASWALTRRDA